MLHHPRPLLTLLGTSLPYAGDALELSVPRRLIGQGSTPRLTFHWSDNVEEDGAIPEFGRLGENAPSRRASYDFAP